MTFAKGNTAGAWLRERSGAVMPKQHPRDVVPRSKATNKPLFRANGNTVKGRRIRDLYRAFMASMNYPTDPLLQANALAAAELRTAAEECRAATLAGTADSGQLEQLIRLENLAARAERRLGIQLRRTEKKPTLDEHLSRCRADRASEASA